MNTLQLQEFFVEGGDHKTSHALLHIAEPSTPEEKKKGYFFAVCEINQGEDRDILTLQNLIDEVENRYYETPEEEGVNTLEEVLTKINHESYVLNGKNLDLHCAVGVLKKDEVFFSCHGTPLMFLFYRNKSGIYQKMDLIDKSEENEESPQLFKQIVQGKISPNDFLFVATPHVADYFNPDRLEKIISTRPVRQSAEHLERVLSELKNKLSFGGLIIHLQQDKAEIAVKKTSPIIKGSSEKSLHNLFATEQQTASTLSSAFIPNLNNKFKNIFSKENAAEQKKEAPLEENMPTARAEIVSTHARQHRPQPIPNTENSIDWIKIVKTGLLVAINIFKNIALAIWWVLAILANIIHSCLRFLVLLFLVITNIKNRRANIIDGWRRQLTELKNSLYQLPLLTKILIGTAVLLGITFFISVSIIRTNRANAIAEKQFNDTVQLIASARDSAESALTYKNENAALTELQTAKNYLSSLNCKNKTATCTELGNQIEALLIKIRKINIVTPNPIIDWGEYQGKLDQIIKIKNKIIALCSETGDVLIYNLLTKEKSALKLNSRLQALTVPKENDFALILTQSNSFWRFNPDDNTIKKVEVSFPETSVKIQSLVIYNRRLYTLDIGNGQIYKHENNHDGFGLGKEWVKNNFNDLKTGVDLAIDGDIFITHLDGHISKFTKGDLQTFTLTGLDPTLNNGAEIWTYNDTESIYVLDAIGKRLINLNKNGETQSQTTAETLQSPTGFTIGDNNKQIYLLDKNKVYSILLP